MNNVNTRPLVVVCLLVTVFFSGCIEEDDPNYHLVTINVGSPDIESRDVAGSLVWDAMFMVHKVTPKDEVIPIDELTVHVTRSWGPSDPTILQLEAREIVHDGQLHAWFIPSPGGGNGLTDGDVIHLTGLTGDHVMSYMGSHPGLDYHGSRFELFIEDHKASDLWLPMLFVEMSEPMVILNMSAGDPFWDVEVTVETLVPETRNIPWNELVLRVIDDETHIVRFTTEPFDSPPNVPVVPFYTDAQGDNTLGVGDTLFKKGMDDSHEGCLFSLIWGGKWLGSGWGVYEVRLPSEFQ